MLFIVLVMIFSVCDAILTNCKQYTNVKICQESYNEFNVAIHPIDSSPSLFNFFIKETYELYLHTAASAIMYHYNETLPDGESWINNYLNPHVFWHGRISDVNQIGPWFDDGIYGDKQHL
eukprot:UN10328